MTFTDIMYATGDGFQWMFKFMKGIGNGPNIVFWVIIIGLFLFWLSRLANYNKEAKENGTLP